MRIVVTRPLPDGERTAALLRARGHDVLLAPLMRIEPVAADLSGAWRGVIVTSANAVRAVTPHPGALRDLPLFAVGARTADTARRHGFAHVTSADGDVGDLVRVIAGRFPANAGPLLYLGGEHRAADLKHELAKHGIDVATRIVYRAVTLGLAPDLVDALKRRTVDAVLHYSKRSAAAYIAGSVASQLPVEALAPRHICLSAQVAGPLRAAGAAFVTVAGQPDDEAMIALAERPQN